MVTNQCVQGKVFKARCSRQGVQGKVFKARPMEAAAGDAKTVQGTRLTSKTGDGYRQSDCLSKSPSQPLSQTPLTPVSRDIISEQKTQGETAPAETDGKAVASPGPGAEAKPAPPSSAAGVVAPDRGPAVPDPGPLIHDRGPLIPDRGPLMMTAIPGGGVSALPGPLEEKHFAGEMEGDFAAAIAMVEPGGPAGRRRSHRSIWGSLIRLLRLDRLRGPATRADRHVAFDGFS